MTRLTAALLAIAASAGLSGCTYGAFGLGYGDGYYDDYYAGSYYGWYDDYYYPGWGYYIYDVGGHRYRWNDHHRNYWEGRRKGRDGHEHWARWDRRGDGDGRRGDGEWRGGKDGVDQAYRDGRREGGNWDGQRDGRRRGDRDGWRGNGSAPNSETAVATPTVRQDSPRRDGRGDGERQGWRNGGRGGGGDGRAGYRHDGPRGGGGGSAGNRGSDAGRQQSSQVAAENRPAPAPSRPASNNSHAPAKLGWTSGGSERAQAESTAD